MMETHFFVLATLVSLFGHFFCKVSADVPLGAEVAVVGHSVQFVVKYDVAQDCNSTSGLEGWKDYLMPCGPSARFYVVIAPCPAKPRDPRCWDPISGSGDASSVSGMNHVKSDNRTSTHVQSIVKCPIYGTCLSTTRDVKRGVFQTDAYALPSKYSPGQYLLASVYFHVEMSSDDWTMQKDLAVRVPFSAIGQDPIVLTPYFNAIAEGTFLAVDQFPVPEFDGHHKLNIYLPPACAENRAACTAAKVVIVTDGDWWFEPLELARKLIARADGLIMERRASPFILVGVPQALTFRNGSLWNCARSAMYTPGPCPESWNAALCRSTQCYGQADLFLTYVSERVLPWVNANYHGAGSGQKAAIVGFSLGGLVSCYAAWARSDVFDAACCSSPSFWYPSEVARPALNVTYFAEVAMAAYHPPLDSLLYVSDGTAEGSDMGGSMPEPGPIPLTVQAMRDAGMGNFPFEQNGGFRHDPLMGWIMDTLWRSLEAILPYRQPGVGRHARATQTIV